MAESSETAETRRQRVFMSYSRADRQRVEGLVSLLEALQLEVFMDRRSILPGMRWRETMDRELGKADVLLIFWTRYAERSKWVRHEYETFDALFPDRPLVPILGDATPPPEKLQARQHSDFHPLINELFATVRDLEEKGVGKRAIRKAILKRLEEEGIELPPDKRGRLLGLFGVLGLTTTPLHLLALGRDLLADQAMTVPSAYYYTAGAAGLSGVLICHGLSGVFDGATADGRILKPDLFPVEVTENQSGTDACDAKGMICVSMSQSQIFAKDEKFFGHSTPTCSAKVIRRPACKEWKTEFAMKGVVLRRSPEAAPDVEDISSADFFCLSKGKGPQGIYEFANCVKP